MICAVFVLVPMLALNTRAETGPVSASERSYGSTNLIRTSFSENDYAVIECIGNTVSAKGKFTYDRITGIRIQRCDESSGKYTFAAHKDNTFETEITAEPEDDGQYAVYLRMKSGRELKYLLFYESGKGWYFPVNGLEDTNRKVFDHIYEAPAEAAALYLSSSDDPAEINSALEQIDGLTKRVTEGIEDDYEKAKAISLFIAKSIYYDMDARESDADLDTIALCNVLKTSRTVCGGFANLFCAMAEAAGLDAVNIKGGVTTGSADHPVKYEELTKGVQNHEWAAFRYEKEDRWVWVDACWDGSATFKNGVYTDSAEKLMYFDITDEAFSFNHRADKAERRHYFAAKAETQLLDGSSEQTGTVPEETAPESVTASDTTAQQETAATMPSPETVTAEQTNPLTTDGGNVPGYPEGDTGQTIYYVIIAVLVCAVAAAAAILIKVILNGRKK